MAENELQSRIVQNVRLSANTAPKLPNKPKQRSRSKKGRSRAVKTIEKREMKYGQSKHSAEENQKRDEGKKKPDNEQ